MRAIEEAALLYDSRQACLADDLTFFLKYGHIICEPDRLLVWKEARREDLRAGRLQEICPPGQGDTWYVHLAVGRGLLRWFFAQAPGPMQWLAWHRGFKPSSNNAIKFHSFQQLKRKLRHGHTLFQAA